MNNSARWNLVIRQVCVPDYRIGLFDALSRKIKNVEVFGGPRYFDASIRTIDSRPLWFRAISSRFLAGRRLVWLSPLLLNKSQPLVVVHEWNPRILSFWVDWVICRWNGLPIIVWGHAWGKDGPQGIMFRLRHWMAKQADGIICYTELQAAVTRKIVRSVPVIAAPNACLWRSECGITGEEVKRDAVIYVGRLVCAKKVGLLIEGFAAALRQNSTFGARLVIVGDGPDRMRLEKLAKETGVSNRVAWMGHLSDVAKLRSVYERAFVSVSPGYVGLSLTQSFAFGVPALVAKDEPHSPEIEAVQEGDNARFFDSNNAADLAAKLQTAWLEWRGIEHRRRELSAWTAENYSFDKMADRFCSVAELVLRKSQRAAAYIAI